MRIAVIVTLLCLIPLIQVQAQTQCNAVFVNCLNDPNALPCMQGDPARTFSWLGDDYAIYWGYGAGVCVYCWNELDLIPLCATTYLTIVCHGLRIPNLANRRLTALAIESSASAANTIESILSDRSRS